MDTYLAIASKRDWRNYADRPIPDDVLNRILDAGRLAGSAQNVQAWRFYVVTDPERKQQLGETVYAAPNVENAPVAIAIVTPEGKYPLDVGRALQNMFLAALNEGVASCPNGMPDPDATGQVLGLEGDDKPVIVGSFGYPAREIDPNSRSAEEWSGSANRKPLDEIVVRL
ncbi:MAG: nitroreductase family protein [Actinomycetota bacterium]|nr:nitroreductase family protein [Actinomycetota bacterium]